MSGVGVVEPDSSKVSRPVVLGAALIPVQAKPSITVVGTNGAFAVKAITKLWGLPAPIDTRVLGEPVSALVAGSVV